MKKTIAIVTIGAIALIGTATTASASVSVLGQPNPLEQGAIRAIPIMSNPETADGFGDLGPYDALAQANQTPNIALSNTAEGGLNEISGIVVRHIDSFAAQRNTNDG